MRNITVDSVSIDIALVSTSTDCMLKVFNLDSSAVSVIGDNLTDSDAASWKARLMDTLDKYYDATYALAATVNTNLADS